MSFRWSMMLLLAARAGAQLPSDSAALDRFATTFIAGLRGKDAVARVAVVFVRDGRIVVARGFGETAAGDSVDPERTVFRAASNSKLFATLAALQLAARGRLRLDEDVNRHLPPEAQLPTKFDKPVTLADLLTHTAGLETKFEGGVTSPGHRMSLAEYFARYGPYRAVPPGLEVSYSNMGMALVGYVVERAAGISFDRYVGEEIFTPFGMTRSTFRQPPPAEWARDLAGGRSRGVRDVVFNPYPAASLVATPMDMGRFIAALETPRSGSDSAAVANMLATHWRAQPTVPGVAYGFFEGLRDGVRYLFHTGDSGDHSVVLLVPERRLGLYFVYSGSDEQSSIRERFAKEFLDRFVGAEPPVRATPGSNVTELAGTYRTAAYSRTNYEKLQAMFMQVRVLATDTRLTVQPPGDGPSVHLVRSGTLTFRGDSGEYVAFRRDAGGSVRGFTISGSIWDPSSWDRIAWYQDGRLHLVLLALFGLAMLARCVVLLVRGWRRAWRSGAWLIVLTPVVIIASAFTSFVHPAEAIPNAVRRGSVVLLLGLTIELATVVWRAMHARSRRESVALGLAAVALVCVSASLAYWQLLPF